MARKRQEGVDPGPLGRYIRQLRIDTGLSQGDLAKLAGLKRWNIDSLERGDSKVPGTGMLEAIAPHLGVTVEQLQLVGGLITYDSVNERTGPKALNVQLTQLLSRMIPVYQSYPKKPGVPIMEHTFMSMIDENESTIDFENIEAYLVNTDYHVSPVIGIGDTIIVDRVAAIKEGDRVVAVCVDGDMVVGRYVRADGTGEIGVSTNTRFFPNCTDIAKITEVHHRFR